MANPVNKNDWCSPPEIVEPVRAFFGGSIDLDPCSNPNSTVRAAHEFIYPEQNGLTDPWVGRTAYVNPPYSRDKTQGTTIYDWFKKMHSVARMSMLDKEIIALVPGAYETKAWRNFVWYGGADAVCLLKKRTKFLGAGCGAKFPTALIYWGENAERFARHFDPSLGMVIPTSFPFPEVNDEHATQAAGDLALS